MPELPEVETILTALRPCLTGRRIRAVHTFTPTLRYPLDLTGRKELKDAKITGLERRGRYIQIHLDSNFFLLLHLGMSGSCRLTSPETPRLRHEHVTITLDDGREWRYHDPRRFGFLQLYAETAALPSCLARLGPEPLGPKFNAKWLHRFFSGRHRAVKPMIMENACVAGVGNIYASESLFHAGIHPAARADRLTKKRCTALVTAIRNVLAEAIRAGGTTIADFHSVDGSEGLFVRELAVYAREGEPCERCGEKIHRTVQSGRATYFCPSCQRR